MSLGAGLAGARRAASLHGCAAIRRQIPIGSIAGNVSDAVKEWNRFDEATTGVQSGEANHSGRSRVFVQG